MYNFFLKKSFQTQCSSGLPYLRKCHFCSSSCLTSILIHSQWLYSLDSVRLEMFLRVSTSGMWMTASLPSRILIPGLLSLVLALQSHKVLLMESVCCLHVHLPFYATFHEIKSFLPWPMDIPTRLRLQGPPNDVSHHVPCCHIASFLLCCFLHSPSTILLDIPTGVVRLPGYLHTCWLHSLLRFCQHCPWMFTCSALWVFVPLGFPHSVCTTYLFDIRVLPHLNITAMPA